MSCFVMDSRALAALATELRTVLNSGYNFCGFDAPDTLREALKNCTDGWGLFYASKIFEELYRVNAAAYMGRYSHNITPEEAAELEEVPPMPDSVPALLKHPAWVGWRVYGPEYYTFLKLLDCWLYQTGEDATYKHPLRLALREMEQTLTAALARNTPDYNAASWGEL